MRTGGGGGWDLRSPSLDLLCMRLEELRVDGRRSHSARVVWENAVELVDIAATIVLDADMEACEQRNEPGSRLPWFRDRELDEVKLLTRRKVRRDLREADLGDLEEAHSPADALGLLFERDFTDEERFDCSHIPRRRRIQPIAGRSQQRRGNVPKDRQLLVRQSLLQFREGQSSDGAKARKLCILSRLRDRSRRRVCGHDDVDESAVRGVYRLQVRAEEEAKFHLIQPRVNIPIGVGLFSEVTSGLQEEVELQYVTEMFPLEFPFTLSRLAVLTKRFLLEIPMAVKVGGGKGLRVGVGKGVIPEG